MNTAASSPSQRTAASLLALGGTSEPMLRLQRQMERIAPHLRSALILSGPGMHAIEVARELHRLSSPAGSSLLELPADILSAAVRSHGASALQALLSRSNPATIAFPDLHRLNSPTQTALLSWLRRPMGTSRPRVIAIAPSLLRSEVSTGAFSAPLLHGLSSVLLEVPPMVDRLADLSTLIPAALATLAAEVHAPAPVLTPEALDLLLDRAALGTLFDLEQILRELSSHPALQHETPVPHAALLSLLDQHLPTFADAEPAADRTPETAPETSSEPSAADRSLLSLKEVVDAHLLRVMHHCNGNKLRAADLLGVSRSTLYRMIEQLPPLDATRA